MSTCADVGSFIESKTSVVQTSNVGFASEVSDYLVVHTGPGVIASALGLVSCLCLGGMESLICNFCLNVAARTVVRGA